MDEDEDQNDEEETNKKSWGGRKNIYYNADNADFEVGLLPLRNYFLQYQDWLAFQILYCLSDTLFLITLYLGQIVDASSMQVE